MYESIAPKLQLSPKELEQASLRLFLTHRLRLVESQLFELARKYGVNTVAELDRLIQGGRVHEDEAFEDYFEFDRLEDQRDLLADRLLPELPVAKPFVEANVARALVPREQLESPSVWKRSFHPPEQVSADALTPVIGMHDQPFQKTGFPLLEGPDGTDDPLAVDGGEESPIREAGGQLVERLAQGWQRVIVIHHRLRLISKVLQRQDIRSVVDGGQFDVHGVH